ncbi:hypothetical protein MN116_008235 [Schistosoma mekongi]|uniref:PDZ domain-containing protein n=1 Tax=Schistosoma mekongi TaxID=38744 RepID=A0AAE1Z5N4_SCHME|nr:hypothetical protein MN116_008235 [Schistosoma mekongi]
MVPYQNQTTLLPKIRFVEEYRSEGSKTISRRIQSKHYQKRLLSAIKRDDVNRVNDLLNQGLDPNFQYPSNGVTPLGYTTELNDPREMILQLVNAGAHLDYRDSNTMTALHRAAICGNLKAIEVLLELGQNPNVRDKHNLTPLYYACSEDIKPECIQRLLYDHAILGVTDDKGRQEIHQACLNGRIKTLRQLIIYGADLNAQVENHNTPLHLCVLADEMECMQMLLSCGASPTIMNSSGQTPYELAILIERMNLAKILQNFDEKSVEGINQRPIYNKDRRPTIHGPRAVYDSVYFTHNNSNNISKCQFNKSLSLNHELPKVNYHRSISFDVDELIKPKPTHINQPVFIHSNNESHLRMVTKPNHINNNNNVKENTTSYNNGNSNIINNRPPVDIKQQSIINHTNNNGSNNNLGRMIYNRSNSHNLPKFSQRLNLLRQRFPNYRIRSIALERGVSGYGFIMQGSNSTKERIMTRNNLPSQRIMSVQPNSKAEKSGLVPGDYLLEINGIDVYDATHTEVVDLITATRDMLNVKIINFQQIPEICSRVVNDTNNNNKTNINHRSNSNTKLNGTSFIRADLRRRNTQRSISVDTPWIARQLSVTTDNHKTNNRTNIITNTTTTTDNSSISSLNSNSSNFINTNDKSLLSDQTLRHYRPYNNNYYYHRSIQSLDDNDESNNHLERKSKSFVLIIKDDDIQQHKSSEIRTPAMNTTQAFTSPLSSSSSSSSPYINTYAGTTNMSNKDNRLQRALSESANVMVTKEFMIPETCQSTNTLHNRLLEKQDIHRLETESLSSTPTTSTSMKTTTATTSSQSPASFALTRLNSTPLIKCKQQHDDDIKDDEHIKSLKYFEQSIQNTNCPPANDYNYQHSNYHTVKYKEEFIDTWDTSWDSASDLLNISEITEISVNSTGEKSLNYIKQTELTNQMSILSPSLSPNKHELINEMNVDMNNQMKSIHSESYLHGAIVDRNTEKTIVTMTSNHSYNELDHSKEYTISVDNLQMNGHNVDDDESDSCLI